jgi:cob(I)alamin adenosyltransferase
MTKFYTRTGDDGFTGLLGEGRVPKNHPRMEALGSVDEATAFLGLARSVSSSDEVKGTLLQIQRDLYHLMAEISALPENAAHFRKIGAEQVAWLEKQTDRFSAQVELPKEFIIPGSTFTSGRVAELLHEGLIENPDLLRYLNRLSSLFFILEVWENQQAGKPTVKAKEENAK